MKYFLPNLAAIKATLLVFFLLISFSNLFSQESMRATLYVSDANGQTVVDGNYTNYDNIYCNCVDWDDASKMTNPGENFGITRENVTLIVERRKRIDERDTTTFRMWNLQQNRNYQVVFLLEHLNHPDMIGFLKDNYLGTLVPVNLDGSSTVGFNINSNPASYAINRFQLIFEKISGSSMPVSFVGINAYRKSGLAVIEWKVENEINISKYMIEKSADGRNFIKIQEITAGHTASAAYKVNDDHPSSKNSFYRVKAIGFDGREQLSNVAQLPEALKDLQPSANVYPNPVVDRNIHLRLANCVAGVYALQLIGANGIISNLNAVKINDSQDAVFIRLPGELPAGIYRLLISGVEGIRINTNVNVL